MRAKLSQSKVRSEERLQAWMPEPKMPELRLMKAKTYLDILAILRPISPCFEASLAPSQKNFWAHTSLELSNVFKNPLNIE